MQEWRSDAPAFLDVGRKGPASRYVKFRADGDYADLFAYSSDTHVVYVVGGLPKSELAELSRVHGVPLFEDTSDSLRSA